MRTLLIDDQASAREQLRELLKVHPGIRITGEAASFADARSLLARGDYDLVFLDVDLVGGTGFELMPEVRAGARVIFATTHDGFALRAFEVNALDYLLKPITAKRLASALSRLSLPAVEPIGPPVRLRLGDTVRLDSGKSSRFVPLEDVSVIDAQQNYSRVHLADGTRVLVRRTLKEWEGSLPARFVRVHRGTVVNLDRVTGCERRARALALKISGLVKWIAVSRLATPAVKAHLHARFPEI